MEKATALGALREQLIQVSASSSTPKLLLATGVGDSGASDGCFQEELIWLGSQRPMGTSRSPPGAAWASTDL